jgi:hypothetical protein
MRAKIPKREELQPAKSPRLAVSYSKDFELEKPI